MIGAKLDAYTIRAELGTGGMGTVYLAETADGRRVAIKVVHPHLIATPGFFKRFLREAEVGKQVRHENVVATLDVDATLHEGQQINYMVMEYVEGRSLRKLLQDLDTVPEALLRAVAVQMAAGLAAIHEQNIIHRDLKPENVLITDDHRVRIMDLGVAKLQEASVAITREGQFAGSLLYAAPEQFRGDDVGSAADLYSLGVMLHEMATGTNPFRADDPSAVIHAHLNVEPPRALDRAQEISLFFSEVIHTLLAKEPAARFASASALHAVLADAEASAWWAAREKELHLQSARLPAVRVSRESEVFGRDAELRALQEAWNEAVAGTGSTVLVEGEIGLGKTRLVDAFMRSLADQDAHILYGCYPPSGGLGALSEAIIDKFGAANLGESLAPYLSETPSLVPAFAALVKHESPPTGSDPLQGDALHTVCCQLMQSLAAEKPTIWVLDELHFAPQESRQILQALARSIAAHRALVVMTSRPGEDVSYFSRLQNFRRLTLGRLSPREVVELLRDAFKSEALADRLGAKIAYKSDGVPLFVFEMIRGLKQSSALERQSDGSWVQTSAITEIEVPSAIRDLIGARLKGLSDDDRNLLDAAAVCGVEFDPDLVARAVDIKPIQALQRLAAMERNTRVVRAAGSGYRFDHHQIQEILYAELSLALRRGYHTLLADARVARDGLADVEQPSGEPACFVARHHLRGSTPRSAKRYLQPALDHLAAAYRHDAEIELLNLALTTEELLSDRERCEMLMRRGATQGGLGQRIEEGDALREALKLADAEADDALRSETRARLGWHLWTLGKYPEAQAACEEALAIARAAGDEQAEKRAAGNLGNVFASLGYQQKALESATYENNRGLAFQYLGRYAEARACFERHVRLEEEKGDRRTWAIGLVNLGRLQAALGDPDTGRTTLEESRSTLRAIGQRRPESYAFHRLGLVEEQVGDLEAAERLFERALAVRREIQYASGVCETLLAFGRLCLAQGRAQDAIQMLSEAQGIAREIDRPDEIALSAAYLGDTVAAEDALSFYGERIRVADAMETHFVLWQAKRRPEHLAEAHRLLRHLRDHAPQDCRDSMMENVPLHRDIVKAWEEHGKEQA